MVYDGAGKAVVKRDVFMMYSTTQFSFDALGISESSITQCTTLVGNIPTYKYMCRGDSTK